jgi:peptidoglycan/xylan/chitin deacetylase (PgdA/CDA1 family)
MLYRFVIVLLSSFISEVASAPSQSYSPAPEICITLDDINDLEKPLYSPLERDSLIRRALNLRQVRAGAFFIGKYLESDRGQEILRAWDLDDHLILNHTYSHLHYNEASVSYQEFSEDVLKCDRLLNGCKNYSRIFRFPYLEEGDTREKRDAMRGFLKKNNYRNGYVSVMTTDWWISAKLEDVLSRNPSADVSKIRNMYLANVKECVDYYKVLGQKLQGDSENKHVILLHHNLLNALFLGDLIDMLRLNGWKVISAGEAFNDPLYQSSPDIFPSSSSLLSTLAQQRGSIDGFEGKFPPENMVYDKHYRKRFGLKRLR